MTYTEASTKWAEQTKAIAASRYYGSARKAELFVIQHILPAWSPIVAATDDDDVLRRFRVTPTQLRILHLFGRGVFGVAAKGTRAPRLLHWPPSRQVQNGKPLCYRVIPTKDIARLIGASLSATAKALDRFKRTGGGDDLHDHGLCAVVSTEIGISLDGIFERQTSFGFMLAVTDYERGGQYAYAHRVQANTFFERQRAWCARGMASHGVVSLPSKETKPVEQSALFAATGTDKRRSP